MTLAAVALAGLAVPMAVGTANAATMSTATPAAAPAKLTSLALSPATATIAPGGSQSYTVQGLDASGHPLGPVTGATFTIKPNGSCTGATCTATALGAHTVTAASKKITGTATLTVAQPTADLAVTETASSATPVYYTPLSFTTTVRNTSTTTASTGITVTAAVPAGLITPTETPSQGSYDGTNTWTVGTLAPGASATLVFSGYAGDVDLHTQTVTATATATTPDPNSANNTASASEASQPAQIGATITPFASNPAFIDIAQTGTVGWTGTAYNTENPNAPEAPATLLWTCSGMASVCPPSLENPVNSPTQTFPENGFSLDTYGLTLTVLPTSDNYTGASAATTITFTTVNSG